jgi:hypothetical protein
MGVGVSGLKQKKIEVRDGGTGRREHAGGDVMERHSDTPTALEGEELAAIFRAFICTTFEWTIGA